MILVGGSTKMPLIAQAIENELNITPLQNVNPDEVVAQGAALLATKRSIEKNANSSEAKILPQNIQNSIAMIKVADIVPHSVGTLLHDDKTGGRWNQIVINHGEKIPFNSKRFDYQFLHANQRISKFELTQSKAKMKIL